MKYTRVQNNIFPKCSTLALRLDNFKLFKVHRGSMFLLQISSGVVWQTKDLHLSHNTLYRSVESSSLLLHSIKL